MTKEEAYALADRLMDNYDPMRMETRREIAVALRQLADEHDKSERALDQCLGLLKLSDSATGENKMSAALASYDETKGL